LRRVLVVNLLVYGVNKILYPITGISKIAVCFIIALLLLVVNYRYSYYAFAQADTKDLADKGGSNGDDKKQSKSGDDEPRSDGGEPKDGKSGDDGSGSDDGGPKGPTQTFSGALASGGESNNDNTGDLASSGSGGSDHDASDDSSDLADQSGNSNGDKFRHNAAKIAMELSSLTPQEISQYPITDLSDEDIKLVLSVFLSQEDLSKVLLNISIEGLSQIQQRITPTDFNTILAILPESDRVQVENRLVSTSTLIS
jgi:hypothetical protein